MRNFFNFTLKSELMEKPNDKLDITIEEMVKKLDEEKQAQRELIERLIKEGKVPEFGVFQDDEDYLIKN